MIELLEIYTNVIYKVLLPSEILVESLYASSQMSNKAFYFQLLRERKTGLA